MHKRPALLSPWGIYAALALAVLAPWLPRGYILTLDMVFTPHLRMPASVTSSYLLRVLLHVLNLALPSDVIQKLLLFAILLLMGVGMYRLVRYQAPRKSGTGVAQTVGMYFAGTLYMINPFTYDRLMAGQYSVLFGYALLPWLARALLNFLERPAGRTAVVLAAWLAAIGVVSIHTLGMALLLMAAGIWLALWRRRNQDEYLPKLLCFALLTLAVFLAASSYWLVPLVLGKSATADTIASIGSGDRAAFATVDRGMVGRLGNVLRLQGFWLEARGMYTLPQAYSRAWGLIALLVWVLVAMGAVSYWRSGRRMLVVLFGSAGVLAIFLAVGIANGWLSAHVPFFAGYREPQKFVALLALVYCVFAARGAAVVVELWTLHGGRFGRTAALITMLALPVVYTPVMLWGCNRQLHPVQYPADWFAMNNRLKAIAGNSQTLFLPWHLYMSYGFTGRIIASPAPQFFDVPILAGDNPEFGGAAAVGSSAQRRLGEIMPRAGSDANLAAELAVLHVQYVLLAKDDDFARYGYLDHTPGLTRVMSSATLELYRNDTHEYQP
jgi:hypothetical protein